MQIEKNQKKKEKKPIILVVGIGGGGCNALKRMYLQHQGQDEEVDFAVINTDKQALENNPVPKKIQIGPELTHGLGAGSNPEVGEQAALESKEELKKLFPPHIKMVFITVGEGGGTGTGAAPIIAEIAKKMGLLTIGIVTHPFLFEGKKRLDRAREGTQKLREQCDTVLVILNERLKQMMGSQTISSAFFAADNVLNTIAYSIIKIISHHGYINVDFEDVRTVIQNAGVAVIGTATAEGQRRSLKAAQDALSSPLLDNKKLEGAKRILLSILSGSEAELQMDELVQITNYIQNQIGNDAEIIFGHGYQEELGEKISVTIIATGFQAAEKETSFVPKHANQNTRTQLYEGFGELSHKHKEEGYSLNTTDQTHQPYSQDPHNSQYRSKADYYKSLGKSFINSFKEGEKHRLTDQEMREKLSVPAYVRKRISLAYTPPPAPDIMTYNLEQKIVE